MRSTRSFVTTSFAGTLLALTIATGAAPALPPIVRDVASSYRSSYHSAVRVYDRARMWGVIARWWVDPAYVPAAGDGDDSSKFENVCQIRSAGGRGR